MSKKRVIVQVTRVETWTLDVELDGFVADHREQLQKIVSEIDENREPAGDWSNLDAGYRIEVHEVGQYGWLDVSHEYQLALPPWACE